MTSMPRTPLLAASALLALCSSAAPPLPEAPLAASPELNPVLKNSEHKKVGGLIGDCIEAYVNREGRRDAEEALSTAIKKKWTKAAQGRDPLALSDDLAASLWYSIDYKKVKGIKKGKIVDLEVPVAFFGDDYVATSAVWTPKKYDTKKKYPLVLCIPEPEEKPEAHLNDHWADGSLRDNAILVALDMPEDPALWGELGEAGNAAKAGGVGILLATFAKVRDNYAVDFDRIFLAGRGPGVGAAMQIASLSPDRFCGIIGRTGDAADLGPDNLSNLPCYFAGGGKISSDFAERTTGEDQAERVLEPEGKLADVWAWMQGVSRRSIPDVVHLVPGSPFPNKAYWLEVPAKEYAEGAKISATADRASNTITIEATGIDSCTIYFNDGLMDLEQPVKVICNGTVNEDMIPRNFNSMMQLIYKVRSDPGRVYTAWKEYDIPATE